MLGGIKWQISREWNAAQTISDPRASRLPLDTFEPAGHCAKGPHFSAFAPPEPSYAIYNFTYNFFVSIVLRLASVCVEVKILTKSVVQPD